MPTYKVELRIVGTERHPTDDDWENDGYITESSKVVATNLLVETDAKVTAVNWHGAFFALINSALQIAQQARESVEIYSGEDIRKMPEAQGRCSVCSEAVLMSALLPRATPTGKKLFICPDCLESYNEAVREENDG